MTRPALILLLLLILLPLTVTTCLADESIVLTGEVQMRLGDAFMAEGEYYRAITEYKRYVILFPDGSHGDTALFRIGMAYYQGMEYQPAAESFALVRSRFPASPHAADAAYHEGVCNTKLNRLDKAAVAFEAAAAARGAIDVAPKARLGHALVQFDRGDTVQTRADLNRFMEEFPDHPRAGKVRDALTLLSPDGPSPRKSPLVAGILSAIVPGSGHAYAGHYGDGATALLLNGLFITGAVVAIGQENYAAAGAIGLIGLPFYLGNIYGAANAASKWNLGVRRELRDRLAVTLDYRF
jgi:TolA-binding protein/TM2 domain-containing membrane protein YozV